MTKVKVDMSGVKGKLNRICNNKQLGNKLSSAAAKGMDKYVPYRTGALSRSVRNTPFKVTYSTPYAKRVYYGQGMNFNKEHHDEATAEWDKAYKIAYGQDLAQIGTNFLKGL